MNIRDRIVELRRVPARQLRPNPKNWRTHPPAQQDALRGVLSEIGYCDALLARELDDGSLELIDGHLRAETTPEMLVPVLVLNVTPEEADKLLATHDTITGLAETDATALDRLLDDVHFDSDAVSTMLAAVRSTQDADDASQPPDNVNVPALFQIVVECRDEPQQQELFERLTAEGLKCRVLTL